jgi:hypothetical protein
MPLVAVFQEIKSHNSIIRRASPRLISVSGEHRASQSENTNESRNIEMPNQTTKTTVQKNIVYDIIRNQARKNCNGYIVDLLEFDLTDEEILILLRAVYANPILESYSPAIGFFNYHIRLCNNFRAIHREVTGSRKKMSFDEAKKMLLSHTDEDELPLIRKYAQ